MSYSITYLTDKTLKFPFAEGAVYPKGGTNLCQLSITSNYHELFDFNSLDKKQGKDVLPQLQAFSNKFKHTHPYWDYWAPTPGNVKAAVDRLISFIELDPNAFFKVNE